MPAADQPSSISIPPEVPSELAGIRLGRVLGVGGMGRVYLGHHPVLDVPVAVKVLLDRGGDDSRFLTEARLAARLQHPRVVRVLNAGEEAGVRFLVMEYVHGSTLKEIVQERGALPWREALGFILQAAEGLAAAHRAGIVHRDVKPSNLMVDAAGGVKVTDLGLARSLVGSSDATVDGAMIGTPAYMAPEQLVDPRRATAAADVYGLGATFAFLTTGSLVPEQQRPSGLQRMPEMPPTVAALVSRMLDRDPARRPADGGAVVREIERVLGLASTSTLRTRISDRLQRTRAPRWLGAAAAASLLVLAGWAVAPVDPAGDPTPTPAPGPVPAAAPAADPWQTPPRALFVLQEGLGAAALAAVDSAALASGLPVVERARIDVLVREQDLVAGGRIDAGSAARVGRLVGGHIALFARPVEDRIELRSVLVETGEIAAVRLVAAGEAADGAATCLAAAARLLPVQGRVIRDGDRLVLSAGRRHGLSVGDRIDLRPAADGPVLGGATVTALTAGEAVLEPVGSDPGPNLVLGVRSGP
jgi:hypothetical protein